MIERVGSDSLEIAPHSEDRYRRGHKGERFSIDKRGGAEDPGAPEGSTGRGERTGAGRRRPSVRYAKRAGEMHGAREHTHEDSFKVEEAEFNLDFFQGDEGSGGTGTSENGEGGGGQGGDAEDRATASDFEALTTHLLNLQEPIREVTLYLPALGRVTARTEAGAINIILDVPRRLLGAVRRGQKEMQERMIRQGLNVARILLETHEEEEPAPAGVRDPGSWPARGLVDVMA